MTHPHPRLHALDGLRAVMMLLGLVLHSAVSYGTVDYGSAWPYKDPATTFAADLTVFFIHVFRMPIFYVLAGFFSALLYLRRGSAGLAKNRAIRIVVPFAVGWILLYPLVAGGFVFSNVVKAGSFDEGMAAVRASAGDGSLFLGDSTMHLWFLYYLIFFYLAALLLAPVVRRAPVSLRAALLHAFESVVSRPLLRPFVLAVVTAGTLIPMDGVLQTRSSFIPDPQVLLAYGVFFGFGWLLYLQRDLLPSFKRWAWTQTLAGTVLFFASEGLIRALAGEEGSGVTAVLLRSAIGGIVVWWLAFGLTGLFLRYLDRPSPVVRYIVDSSYWVYLVHLPCTIWLPGLLSGLAWSPWLKMAAVLAGTTFIGTVSYDLFVRSSFIGRVLNGRRYPRGLPRHDHPPAVAAEAPAGR